MYIKYSWLLYLKIVARPVVIRRYLAPRLPVDMGRAAIIVTMLIRRTAIPVIGTSARFMRSYSVSCCLVVETADRLPRRAWRWMRQSLLAGFRGWAG